MPSHLIIWLLLTSLAYFSSLTIFIFEFLCFSHSELLMIPPWKLPLGTSLRVPPLPSSSHSYSSFGLRLRMEGCPGSCPLQWVISQYNPTASQMSPTTAWGTLHSNCLLCAHRPTGMKGTHTYWYVPKHPLPCNRVGTEWMNECLVFGNSVVSSMLIKTWLFFDKHELCSLPKP